MAAFEVPAGDLPWAGASVEHGFICGSSAKVAAAIGQIDELGVGGVITSFRLGPMLHEAATSGLTLLMRQAVLLANPKATPIQNTNFDGAIKDVSFSVIESRRERLGRRRCDHDCHQNA